MNLSPILQLVYLIGDPFSLEVSLHVNTSSYFIPLDYDRAEITDTTDMTVYLMMTQNRQIVQLLLVAVESMQQNCANCLLYLLTAAMMHQMSSHIYCK